MFKIMTRSVKFTSFTIISLVVASFGVPGFNQSAEAITDQSIVILTNHQRQLDGLPPLDWNAKLSSSAWAKARDMCQRDYWSHQNPDGQMAWELIDQSGYDYEFAGENLAKGYETANQQVNAWMNSLSHRANILNPNFKEIGTASLACEYQGKHNIVTVAHYAAR